MEVWCSATRTDVIRTAAVQNVASTGSSAMNASHPKGIVANAIIGHARHVRLKRSRSLRPSSFCCCTYQLITLFHSSIRQSFANYSMQHAFCAIRASRYHSHLLSIRKSTYTRHKFLKTASQGVRRGCVFQVLEATGSSHLLAALAP